MSGLSFKVMQRAAAKDKVIGDRVELLVHCIPEELCDFSADPGALRNLSADPAHQEQPASMRQAMSLWMGETRDPLLEKFRALPGATGQDSNKAAEPVSPDSAR